jgi:hypothetical protein
MYGKWKVFKGDSTSSCDLLFTVKRTSLVQVKARLGVFLAQNTSEQVCDFKIKASYYERSCAIYLGNSSTMVAQVSTIMSQVSNCISEFKYILVNTSAMHLVLQMERKFTVSNVLLGKDTYCVTVFPNVDYIFITALAVIMDEVHRVRK